MKVNKRRQELISEIVSKRQLDLCVVLENVQDDHNIGAVLRTCDAVGIQELYILNTEPLIKKRFVKVGKRTSAGTRKYLNVFYYNDPEACFSHIKSKYKRILGTSLGEKSVSLYKLDLTESAAFVFGNEKTGITPGTQPYIEQNFLIPMNGFAQSLNISVACAISLDECYRQREQKGMYTDAIQNDKQELLQHYLERSRGKVNPSVDYKIFSSDTDNKLAGNK